MAIKYNLFTIIFSRARPENTSNDESMTKQSINSKSNGFFALQYK